MSAEKKEKKPTGNIPMAQSIYNHLSTQYGSLSRQAQEASMEQGVAGRDSV